MKVDLSLSPLFTFDQSKQLPFHNWFYYKEGYSPKLIDYCLQLSQVKKPLNILDPFCGVGTTLLRSKELGINSIGIDSSPLAIFVSRVKCDDYSKEDIDYVHKFIQDLNISDSNLRWEFELFSSRAAFPKRNYNTILSLREQIENIENQKAAQLLLLALLSILPQCSIIKKDGGVLKIDKKKSAIPVKIAFKRKVNQILTDLENPISGPIPQINLGDARKLPLQSESVDFSITSPPYLNNIDYSKVYGLELSLLSLEKQTTELTRSKSLRSFITHNPNVNEIPAEVGDIGKQIPVIGTYFYDMENVIKEVYRVLKPDGEFYLNVTNSVIHQTHILVDEVLAEIAERIGFSTGILVGAKRIADVKPRRVETRESIVVMKK